MISPKKIKNYTKLAMMKSTQAQKSLDEIETGALISINQQFNSVNQTLGQISDMNNQLMQDILVNENAINSLAGTIQTIQNTLDSLNLTISNLTQRVEALESI